MNKGFKCLVIVLALLIFLTACSQESRVKGVRERKKLESEPEIIVQLPEGGEKKLKFEEYITGVVAGEMESDWPLSAYGAQAIIARTFALKYMEENQTKIISGSYEYAQEYKPEKITAEVRKGVESTRGEVAVYKDDYIKGWFHASAGGNTTSAQVGLAYPEAEPPYIKSVKSPDDYAPDEIKNWEASFSSAEIEAALHELGKEVGSLQELKILEKDQSGRVVEFEFTGSGGSRKVKAADFRVALDPKKLKSTKISDMKKTASGYIFYGSGFGHGVGMSQWGAYALAREGKSPEEIVLYYFKDIEIVKEYD